MAIRLFKAAVAEIDYPRVRLYRVSSMRTLQSSQDCVDDPATIFLPRYSRGRTERKQLFRLTWLTVVLQLLEN